MINVPIARTSLTEDEIQSVLGPLRSGWLVQGPHVEEFEDKWSAFSGARNSIAVTSCTSALHLALAAMGIGPGDEVIVPAFTWVATANIIEHLGATVVFCDIDLETFNIDVDQARSKVTPKTRALIPVHLFGLACDMAPVMALAVEHDLKVVEDAACGFGARYQGRHVGTFGDAGCFSFHPRKSITTGEGGMVTTDDDKLAEKIRRLRNHGAAISDMQRHVGPRPYLLADHPDAGYNQRMTDFQAALGSAQMERAQAILDERATLAVAYDGAFSAIEWLQTPARLPGYTHGYQSYPCLFRPEPVTLESVPRIHEMRNAWMDNLQKNGVSTRPATHAVHMLSFYRDKYRLRSEDFPNAYAADQCSISLPLFNGMTRDEQQHVIEAVKRGYC